jgi:hypothetical protein
VRAPQQPRIVIKTPWPRAAARPKETKISVEKPGPARSLQVAGYPHGVPVKFVYDTGIRRKLFHDVRLWGSWNQAGQYSDEWSEVPMKERACGDGGVAFEAEVALQASEVGKQFSWRVITDGLLGLDRDAITTEASGAGHDALHRTFELSAESSEQRYYLTMSGD